MTNIPLPNKISYQEGETANAGRLIVEPCYPGYGVMIGNALRRVLLSSLAGGAVTAIKIKGVTHEFSTIAGVEEDVVEIILNFKKLHLKIHTDQEVVLKLKVKGAKDVTAKDIEKNSEVEIGNPELILAHLTSKEANLEIDIYVSKGIGYIPTEEKVNEDKAVGVINIDSVFTPVQNVSMSVENVRVGKMTNYDKLVMDILTDGTVTPKEAVQESAQILINQFSVLVDQEASDDVQSEVETETETETEEEVEAKPSKKTSKKK